MSSNTPLQEQEFHTKEFKAYFSFDVKEDGMQDENGNEILRVKGYANFSGNVEDESSVFVDHAGDVIVPSGFDLSVWKGNPQVLWQHNRDYSIGKGYKATKKSDGLEIEAEIHKNAMEEEDWYRIKSGLVTKFSVGFRTKAGEWREINKTPVFFITKALLYEVSVVTIPCNAASGFSIVKSLGDGSFSFGDLNEKDVVEEKPTHLPSGDTTTIKDENTMKIKLKEMLPEAEVKRLEAMGATEVLEAEQEVSIKQYIEALVAEHMEKVKTALLADLSKKEEPPAQEEVPAAPSTNAEVPNEGKENESTEVKEDEVSEEQLKALTAAVEKLKALV